MNPQVFVPIYLFGICAWGMIFLSYYRKHPDTFRDEENRAAAITAGVLWPVFACALLVVLFIFLIIFLEELLGGDEPSDQPRRD